MTKEEAKNKLRKAGYQVVDDNSVVTVLLPKDMPFKATLNEIRKKLSDAGYKASFSVRQLKDGEQAVKENAEDDTNLPADIDEEVMEADSALTEDAVTPEPDEAVNEAIRGEEDPIVSGSSEEEETARTDDAQDADDSSMILSADAVQFSLDDFGLGF